MNNEATPIYILSGFLGSGKTTLLTRLISFWKREGLKPAIVMNEIGEVNIDGMIAGSDIPAAEMLGGCICCSIRADLASGLARLIKNEKPDVIVIEATGAANPMEILDATAEAALYLKIQVKQLITVVDTAHLLHLHREQKGKTYRLMQEQIRCASALILNKMDRVSAEALQEAKDIVTKWNGFAPMLPAVRCEVDLGRLLHEDHEHDGFEHTDLRNNDHRHDHHGHDHGSHASHGHVMSYTHYLKAPLDSREFEAFVADLPREVYRAKGILTFSDTASRFLFQYAFRESDFTKANVQESLEDVIVFIGEHFSRSELQDKLERLEGAPNRQQSRV
ncbi:CobW family GTP-binding protein [Paenibacillus sp. DMB20]|uniref:CobW family GTP-binding protein n=1 Tax=Paenibacillus sp. DMB20 TaxID=1642570 RepID=UPI000627C6AD|nr:GTP-binding protein [Paenibacillus sp. DMB20]KKO53334.1 cobalamin biosynthesis protein [Paenibacillus sp. DMB20]